MLSYCFDKLGGLFTDGCILDHCGWPTCAFNLVALFVMWIDHGMCEDLFLVLVLLSMRI